MNILLFDGGNQNTLAIARHLGRDHKDISIHCIIHNKLALSRFSRYVSKSHLLPKIKSNEALFLEKLLLIIKENNIEILFPVGSTSFSFCIKYTAMLNKKAKMILPPEESFYVAESKQKTYELAEQLNIPYPKTYKLYKKEEIKHLSPSYPAVIKAPFEMGKNVVEYADSKEELISKFNTMCDQNGFNEPDLPLIQEFIKGDGYGFFGFYKNGVNQCSFSHKRIREFPVTGGASTCAISFEDKLLNEYGEKILNHLNWNGVAMVEFKKDIKNGEYKLMEINPKFWGSLELAIRAGINFPEFVLNDLSGKKNSFPVGFGKTTFQWFINGEILHFLYRPFTFFKIIKASFNSKKDIWWSDPLPNIIQFILIPLRLRKK